MARITVSDLNKTFDGVVAVDHVDIAIDEGSLTTLLGPSGCGKTTTLRMIAGLEKPTSGMIAIGGEVVFSNQVNIPPERRRIGMVFQSYAIWPHMSVFENVAFPLRAQGMRGSRVRERVDHALQRVQLDHLAARYPNQLSGGQQQRVALARAIVFEPGVLLLDEPLSNLDAQLRQVMRSEIRSLQQELAITTVFVTHDQDEALALSDRVAVMNAGRIVQFDSPRAVYERPASRFVAEFVGWKNFLLATVKEPGVAEFNGTEMQVSTPSDAVPGAAVALAIRPDHVDAVADGESNSANVVEATVAAEMFMGSHTIYHMRAGEEVLEMHAPANVTLSVGSTARVRLPTDRILVFDDDAS